MLRDLRRSSLDFFHTAALSSDLHMTIFAYYEHVLMYLPVLRRGLRAVRSSLSHPPRRHASTLPPTAEANAPTKRRFDTGLINSTSTNRHYASALPIDQATADLLTTPGLFWQAAEADAATHGVPTDEHVRVTFNAARQYVEGCDMCERKETLHMLRSLMNLKGSFTLFVGGVDMGKTFMLTKLKKDLEDNYGRRVAFIDARMTGTDLGTAMVTTRAPATGFLEALKNSIPAVAGLVNKVFTTTAPLIFDKSVSGMARSMMDANSGSVEPAIKQVLQAFLSSCDQEKRFPCLIIDHANIMLASDTPERLARTMGMLRLFTTLSKTHKHLNVLLSTSHHEEPLRLQDIGFVVEHIGKLVVASEVCPVDMRRMLQHDWKMGEHLSAAFLSVYGGQIWRSFNALFSLCEQKKYFAAVQGFDFVELASLPSSALNTRDMLSNVIDTLRRVAEDGFAPIESPVHDDVKLLCSTRLVGVVSRASFAIGVPPAAWQDSRTHFVLIPINQAKRLLIAKWLFDRGLHLQDDQGQQGSVKKAVEANSV